MHKPADRSKLFLPFAALTGFEELVQARTETHDKRRVRTDEENETLSRHICALQRGMRIRVTYYADGQYRTCCGTVRQTEPVSRTLILTDKRLPFDDIYAIEAVDTPD